MPCLSVSPCLLVSLSLRRFVQEWVAQLQGTEAVQDNEWEEAAGMELNMGTQVSSGGGGE